jgi:hypothetical protein
MRSANKGLKDKQSEGLLHRVCLLSFSTTVTVQTWCIALDVVQRSLRIIYVLNATQA